MAKPISLPQGQGFDWFLDQIDQYRLGSDAYETVIQLVEALSVATFPIRDAIHEALLK